MKTKWIPIAALLVAGASPLFAQAPSSPTTASWTGFYAGVQGSVAFNTENDGRLAFDTNLDGNYSDTIAAFGNNFDGSFDSGFAYGLHIGYDYQIGRWVVGAQGEVSRVDIRQRQSGFSFTPAFYTEERSLDELGSIRARAGFLITERLLGYATAGVAFGDDESRMLTNSPATLLTSGNDSDGTPYVVGVGLETLVTDRISLGLEYLYFNFGDSRFVSNFSGPAAFSTIAPSTNMRGSDRDFDFNKLQARLSFRF